MMKKLKVATYNICHGVDYLHAENRDGATAVNLDLCAEVIREIGADVIGMNEVYSVGEEDMTEQTEKLAARASYPYCRFARGFFFPWQMDIGNAVMSRYPILSLETVPVPAPVGDERRPDENEWYEDRVILCVKLDVEGTPVRFISTHFGLNLQEKERMMARLLPLLDREKMPTVLLGDFNAQPDDAVLAPLFDRLKSAAAVRGNTECTFSAWDPYLRIDYIFVSDEFDVTDYRVIHQIASDHMPICADLLLHE